MSIALLMSALLVANSFDVILGSKTSLGRGRQSATSVSKGPSVGLRYYRRYHANDSFIGQRIPCTDDEKICFGFNTLYSPDTHHCLPNPLSLCTYAGDRNEFLHGSGHLFAVCPGYKDPCPGHRMAFDGRCYRKEIVRSVICGCEAEPTTHFLGGKECRCSPASPVYVQQPKEAGQCRIPDLRFPSRVDLEADALQLLDKKVVTLGCSVKQHKCFSKGKVSLSGKEGCYRIHEQGPCPKNHVVVLSGQKVLAGRAEGVCADVRGGCPSNQKRYDFDGQCHDNREINLISPGPVYFTYYGQHIVLPEGTKVKFEVYAYTELKNPRIIKCVVSQKKTAILGVAHYSQPVCGSNNKGFCKLYEVEAEEPMPLDDD